MTFIDLSHIIEPGMPVYPGTPDTEIKETVSIEKDGFRELSLNITGHTGTHMDVPAHVFANGKFLHDIPVSQFTGKAFCFEANCNKKYIEAEDLQPYTTKIESLDFFLIHTGWDKLWGTPSYFLNFPVLSPTACKWLGKFNLKGVGIDCISIDATGDSLENHKILLSQNILIIENLCHLGNLKNQLFEFSAFPLPIKNGDGSPVRAIASFP